LRTRYLNALADVSAEVDLRGTFVKQARLQALVGASYLKNPVPLGIEVRDQPVQAEESQNRAGRGAVVEVVEVYVIVSNLDKLRFPVNEIKAYGIGRLSTEGVTSEVRVYRLAAPSPSCCSESWQPTERTDGQKRWHGMVSEDRCQQQHAAAHTDDAQ
jgi:hypothetical protein